MRHRRLKFLTLGETLESHKLWKLRLYGPRLSVCTELMARFLDGQILPWLLTEHLTHSLDESSPSSWPDWISSITPRAKIMAWGIRPPIINWRLVQVSRGTSVASSGSHLVKNIAQRGPPIWRITISSWWPH